MKAMPLFQKKSLVLLISCLGILSSMHDMAYASIVREDVDYQDFRDFAENKGRFTVGATNIQVHDKDGKLLGEVLKGAPMPDFSALKYGGTGTLFDPQYIAGAAHTGNSPKTHFSGSMTNITHSDLRHFNYMMVSMDNYPTYKNGGMGDYHIQRSHKLVTEVVPIPMADIGTEEDYTTNQKYLAFAHVGSGRQSILPKSEAIAITVPKGDNIKSLSDAHRYLIGGEMRDVLLKTTNPNDSNDAYIETISEKKDENHPDQYITHVYTSPMAVSVQHGDSGSPILGYNKNTKQWEFVAVVSGGDYKAVTYNPETKKWDIGETANSRWWLTEVLSLARPKFSQQIIDKDKIIIENSQSDFLSWEKLSDTKGKITQTNSNLAYDVPLVTQLVNPNNNVYTKDEEGFLNTGKTLHFTGQDGTLELTGSINQGAGALYFDNNFTVRTTNPTDTWLGAGVSVAKDKTVTWQVKNPENDRLSKIGEGTLIVNGVGVNKGDISVGDGIVVLNQQADSTGNKQAFNTVGIVSGRGTVKLMDSQQIDPNKLYFGYRGGRLDLNGNDLTFNYIRNFDQGARLVNHHPTQKSTITLLGDKNMNRGFNGFLGEDEASKNGQLDIIYDPTIIQQQQLPYLRTDKLLLTGGSNLNGSLTVKAGTIFLSGRPMPHAYDEINNKEVVDDENWLNSNFTVQNFNVHGNGKLYVSRNVTNLVGNINATDQSTIQLGYNKNDFLPYRSDYGGYIGSKLTENHDSVPIVQFVGNLNLKDNSQITLGKAHMTGSANASQTSQINLSPQAHWTMTNNSQVGNLAMTQGSQITLNTQPNEQYNTLTITGNLTGAGQFNYLTNLTKHQGDKVVVQGTAEGQYGLLVKNSGKEPVYREQHLTLLSLQNANQANKQVNIELLNPNKTVDLGAYRYTLENNGQDYYLYNPYLSVKEVTAKGDSVKSDALKPYEGEISTKGSGVTHELPVGHLEMKGSGVTHELPAGHLEMKGSGVTHELPAGHLEMKGSGVTHELPAGPLEMKGSGVTHELPAGHLEMKGSGVTHELPAGHLEMKGSGVTHELPAGHLEMKGESVKAEPLPAIDIQQVLNSQHSLPTSNVLPQSAIISRYANTALSDWSAQVQAVKLSGQAISKKLQSLKPEETGLWTHIEYANNQYGSHYHRDYEQHNRLVQFGVDKGINTDWGNAIAGTSLSHINSDTSFDDAYQSDGKLTLLSAYGKVQSNNGLFTTADIGYGRIYDKIRSQNYLEQADVKRNIVMAGAQLGKTWDMAGIQLTPTIGLRYMHLAKNRYSLDDAEIDTPKLNLMTYEAGVELGKKFVSANGATWKPNISASYSDTNRQKEMYVNGHQLQQRFGQSWNTRAGLDMRMKRLSIALNAGYSDGKNIGKQKTFSIGSSYSW